MTKRNYHVGIMNGVHPTYILGLNGNRQRYSKEDANIIVSLMKLAGITNAFVGVSVTKI